MSTFRFIIALSVVAWFGLAGPSRLASQQPATLDTAPAKVVKFDLIVEDEDGKSIQDINANDLELTYDGAVQKISYFEKVERPILYTVAVDTSESFRPLLVSALGAAKLLIRKNTPSDETMLMRFAASDHIEPIVPFTSDKAALLNVPLEKFRLLTGGSGVLDALYLSADAVSKHKAAESNFRRAVVLISDGEDRTSFYKLSQVTAFLQETNVQVFVIGMTSALDKDGGHYRESMRRVAETLLTKVANGSGGRVFFPKTPKELIESVDQIAYDLRSQYVVGFEPNIESGKKGYQKFKLKMARTSQRAKLKTITRPGFWLTPPEPKKKN